MAFCRYSRNNGVYMTVIPLNVETNRFWKYNKNVSEEKRKRFNAFFFRKDVEVKTGSEE